MRLASDALKKGVHRVAGFIPSPEASCKRRNPGEALGLKQFGGLEGVVAGHLTTINHNLTVFGKTVKRRALKIFPGPPGAD